MSARKRPNILLIGVDSLRADRLSCYGYHRPTTPQIDAFARQGVLFERTYSPQIPTTSAYASMLTGRDCFGTGVVALRHRGGLAADVRTLAEILGAEGYTSTCVGFTGNPAARGFDRYLDYEAWASPAGRYLRKAESLNEVALPELERLGRSEQPFFLFLRHMDPHTPYCPPPPFERIFYAGDERDPAKTSMEPVRGFAPFWSYFESWLPEGITDRDYVLAQYDGAVAYLDACLSTIFAKLELLGVLDETVVVLNGDHGETLDEHECWFDHHGLYDVTLHVPLIVRYPKRLPASRRILGFNTHKDLVPTLLELAGVQIEEPLDGRSLLRLVDGTDRSFEPELYLTECTWMRKHGWRTPEWKLIVALEPDFHFKPPVELYNLVSDPAEDVNLAEREPAIVELLRSRMQAFVERRERQTGRPNPIADPGDWHGVEGAGPFSSSEQAYQRLFIGSSRQAHRLQADEQEQAGE